MPRAALGPVRLEFNGGGVAAFRKSSLPSADTSKVLYLQCLENTSAVMCGFDLSRHSL